MTDLLTNVVVMLISDVISFIFISEVNHQVGFVKSK